MIKYKLLLLFFLSVGILVDRTGQYSHVFLACSAVVASASLFLMVSFCWLDRREKGASLSEQGHPSAALSAPVDAALGCQYSSVPTEGDKDKSNGAEFLSSV